MELCSLEDLMIKDFSRICRTCLEEAENLSPLNKTILGNIPVVNLLEALVQIKVDEDEADPHPRSICSKCCDILVEIHNFKKQCKLNEATLNKFFDLGLKSSSNKGVTSKTFLLQGNSLVDSDIDEYDASTPVKTVLVDESHLGDPKIEDCSPDFTCKSCPTLTTFNTLIEYRKHCCRVHQKTRQPITCTICNKKVSKDYLKTHLLVHSGEKPYKCDICSEHFTHLSNVKRHMRTHTGERPYLCSTCGKSFIQSNVLKAHMKVHLKSPIMSCNTTDQRQPKLKDNICPQGPPFECKFCPRISFDNLIDYRQHCKVSHGKTRRLKACDICGKNFQYHRLKSHMMVHSGERPYECEICLANFSQKGNLKRHMMKHTGERRFLCTSCGKSFIQLGELKSHKKIHLKPSRQVPTCEICSKPFKYRHELKRHMVIHTGGCPYVCSICDKGFARNHNLTVHLRIHTGEMPYVCEICGESCRDSNSLKKHMQKHSV